MQFQIISCKTLDTLLKKSNYLLIARDLARNGYPVMSLYGGYTAWQKHKS